MKSTKQDQVTGNMEVISECPKPRVKDRIFDAACELFYRHGIRAVGVDAIAEEAGTNKMSFYRSFASKDELVAEYLREEEREAWKWWDDTIAAHTGNPKAQIEALFGTLVEKTCCDESRGCALANAAVEFPDAEHPARAVVEHFKAEMRERFRKLARETTARDPDTLGDALMLLWEGSYLTRLTFDGESGPSHQAAHAASKLIDAYTH